MSSVPVYIESLRGRGFSYDYVRDQWYDGKKKVAEENVLIFLIKTAKSYNKPEAGSVANKWLHLAKTEPIICFARFKKLRLRRNRNRRIAGKDLYAAFREDVGDPLSDDPNRRASELTTWCMHIRRFYDLVSDGGYATCRSRGRMAGKVLRSVFIGIELVDAAVERIRAEAEEIVENEVCESPEETPASVMRPGFEHIPDPGTFAANLLKEQRFDRSKW